MEELTRRRFLEFMGRGAAIAATAPLASTLYACSTAGSARPSRSSLSAPNLISSLGFRPLPPSSEDSVLLPRGFQHSILAQWDDVINQQGERFGTNCDYLAYFPLDPKNSNDGLLWVNHEYLHSLFVSGHRPGEKKTRKQVIAEQKSVGGSIVRIQKNAAGKWQLVKNDPYNRRISGQTPIPLVSTRPIADSKMAVGTFANCAGGVTPWGTVLTCEENYQDYYGETDPKKPEKRIYSQYHYGWDEYFNYPPEHYGWVVEVNPRTGDAKKLTALGRFAHECATTVVAKDGRCVAYSGDDANDECIYKFISDQPGSLEKGTLYVADTRNGRWLPLDLRKNPDLHAHFKDQTDLLIHTRKAAHLVGGTPQARPEDIEIDPKTGAVLVALTNNKPKGNFHGSLLKIEEENNDPLSLRFRSSTFIAGGTESGFSSPDNLAFDPAGNLWITTDVSGSDVKKSEYKEFGNNSLFYIPMSGPHAGEAFRVATAPIDAEFTGPFFSPDGKTLFLSVQHPGEYSRDLNALTSHWPRGGKNIPRSSVIAITGPALERLTQPQAK